MRSDVSKTVRKFRFNNGTVIEIAFHYGRRCFMATKGVPPYQGKNNFSGFGNTRRAALKALRLDLAMRVQVRLNPELKHFLDEFNYLPKKTYKGET